MIILQSVIHKRLLCCQGSTHDICVAFDFCAEYGQVKMTEHSMATKNFHCVPYCLQWIFVLKKIRELALKIA